MRHQIHKKYQDTDPAVFSKINTKKQDCGTRRMTGAVTKEKSTGVPVGFPILSQERSPIVSSGLTMTHEDMSLGLIIPG